jgi:hypothetical protein
LLLGKAVAITLELRCGIDGQRGLQVAAVQEAAVLGEGRVGLDQVVVPAKPLQPA